MSHVCLNEKQVADAKQHDEECRERIERDREEKEALERDLATQEQRIIDKLTFGGRC